MRIPMRGAVGSLNAAVAGSILLFEAVAQRDPEGAGAPPRPVPGVDAAEIDAAEPRVEAVTAPELPAVDTETAQAEPKATEPEVETTEPELEPPTPERGATETDVATRTEPEVASTTETAAPEPTAPEQPGSAPVKATKPKATKPRATKPAARRTAGTTSGSARPRFAKSDAVAEADELLPGGPPVQPPDHSDPEGT
jgi:hypothetical protein